MTPARALEVLDKLHEAIESLPLGAYVSYFTPNGHGSKPTVSIDDGSFRAKFAGRTAEVIPSTNNEATWYVTWGHVQFQTNMPLNFPTSAIVPPSDQQ